MNSESFSIKFVPNNNDFSRFAISAGLKVSKKSVLRNKIKRKVSEIIRLNYPMARPGYDVVLVIKVKAINKEPGDLKKDLIKELSKIGQ